MNMRRVLPEIINPLGAKFRPGNAILRGENGARFLAEHLIAGVAL